MTAAPSLRLDKWLWQARFYKSRARATRACIEGRIRLNRTVVEKPHQPVRPGEVLTFALGPTIRVVRILALGSRRGPAAEARALFDELAHERENNR